MLVEAQVTIRGSREAVWAAITDLEHASDIISGITHIEILSRPSTGLAGLRWRETRMLFGKPATVEKWVTDAAQREFYTTRAESDGFVFVTRVSMADGAAGVTVTSSHDSQPQTTLARVQSIPMGLLFKGVIRKAILQDLHDIKVAVEQGQSTQ
jgi:hypothetical protein